VVTEEDLSHAYAKQILLQNFNCFKLKVRKFFMFFFSRSKSSTRDQHDAVFIFLLREQEQTEQAAFSVGEEDDFTRRMHTQVTFTTGL